MLKSIMVGIIIAISSIASAANNDGFDVQKEIKQNEVIYHVNMGGNERVQIGDSNLVLILTELEDLRCPVGLSCWWEGGIVLHMTSIKDGQITETILIYQDQPTSLKLSNRIVTIADIVCNNGSYQIVLKMANVNNE